MGGRRSEAIPSNSQRVRQELGIRGKEKRRGGNEFRRKKNSCTRIPGQGGMRGQNTFGELPGQYEISSRGKTVIKLGDGETKTEE